MNNKMMVFVLAGIFAAAGLFTPQVSADIHLIKGDDTLYKVSQEFQASIEALKEVDYFADDLIYVEETLETNKDDPLYTIEKGDTLYRIAIEYNTTVEQLEQWNGLSSDLIYAGDTLIISEPLEEDVTNEVKSASNENVRTQTSKKTTPAPAPTPTLTPSPAPNTGKTMTVEATAYTAYCDGCSGTTANGTNLRANPNLKVIAVDPRVIPLGTKVWVEGYGEAVAADTGGAIKGNKIDVFIPNLSNAYEWGRRTVTIKILN